MADLKRSAREALDQARSQAAHAWSGSRRTLNVQNPTNIVTVSNVGRDRSFVGVSSRQTADIDQADGAGDARARER